MARLLTRSGLGLLVVLGYAAVPAVALTDDGGASREGDIWDWRDHEPVPFEVLRDEQAAGVAQSARQRRNANDDVERIYRQLMDGKKQEGQ